MRAVASLEILCATFVESTLSFREKKSRGVMYHNTEEWCKIWGGADLWFEKWQEKFGEFWSNTWKSQNFHFNGLLLTQV